MTERPHGGDHTSPEAKSKFNNVKLAPKPEANIKFSNIKLAPTPAPIAVDVTVNGIPRDLTGSRWHAPIHGPDGRPAGAYVVTIGTPPDATIPCRLLLTLDAHEHAQLPAGCALTLEQHRPARRTWWQAPVPEPVGIVTEHGEILADEHDAALDWSEVTVIDLRPDGCNVHTTRDGIRPARSNHKPAHRVNENARQAFRNLDGYDRSTRHAGYKQRSIERLARIRQDFPSTTLDAADWLADDEAFTRLARDLIVVGLAEPGRIGPRASPDPADARAEWHRLRDAATVHEPEPEPAAPQTPPQPSRGPRIAEWVRLPD